MTVTSLPTLQHPAIDRLIVEPRPGSTMIPDEHQQQVIDLIARRGHGPTLLLAGPGTGKTSTIVEAVAARVAAGTDPAQILTLTFGRKAATELRVRIGARLQRTVEAPLAWTFHAFGYSLVQRMLSSEDSHRLLRLMSGPEQDVAVRDLLGGDLAFGLGRWPEELHAALSTRGFTDEVRALIGRARGLGLQPDDLRRVAEGRSDWLGAADFLAEYLDVLDARGVVDYAELIARAVAYAESDEGMRDLRQRYELVVVDEYQDTDPAQERLLQAIAGSGRDLLVVGDPDQAIYRFRGADVDAIMSFPDRFLTAYGAPATTRTLRTSRRCPTQVLAATRKLAAQLGGAGTSIVRQLREHRDLRPGPDQRQGQLEVRVFASPEAEAASVADLLRREHLQNGTPWSDMAVLVRSGVLSIPRLQRALLHADIPVSVAANEVPLANESAVSPLMLALHAAADPSSLTDDVARELLVSPLIGCPAAGLRRLGRALRDQARRDESLIAPQPSQALIGTAVRDPALLEGLPNTVAAPARRLANLLCGAGALVEADATAHEVLWSLWDGTSWPGRLRQRSRSGGSSGRAADRDLDAIVALFEVAASSDARTTARDVASFSAEVEARQIPGDRLGDREGPTGGVRVMTAHRSKGLEWSVVVVCEVQEDVWPDVRSRPSFLRAERLGPRGLTEPLTLAELRREERRLFYVAATRAKRRLVVTAIDGPGDDGPRPSPFLAELGVPIVSGGAGPQRPLTLTGLTARLRSVVIDPRRSVGVRRAAAQRLAVLARAESGGRPLVPAADPKQWWGMSQTTQSDTPVRPIDQPIELSGSQLEKLNGCRLQWFLSHEVSGDPARGSAAGFGGVVHALADGVASGEAEADLGALLHALDSVWQELPFGAAWESAAERREAEAVLRRFLAWHADARGRLLLATEQDFACELSVAGRQVRLRGRLDRLELAADGSVVVVDLKTMRAAPSQRKVDEHLQLATYQRVVSDAGVPGINPRPGGAELVQLRVDASRHDDGPKVQRQAAYPQGVDRLDAVLDKAVTAIALEDFRPTVGEACTYCPFVAVCPAQARGQQVIG